MHIDNRPRTARALRLMAATFALTFIAAACGTDDGATVRDLGETEGEASASETASASGSSSAPADEPVDCAPVNSDLETQATQTITVTNTDFEFSPSDLEADAGVITFAVINDGDSNHELAFLPGGGEVPFTNGVPDEDALADAGVFELEAFGPGQTCNATYELEPGTYTIFCIVEAEDGETHYEKGMKGELVVS